MKWEDFAHGHAFFEVNIVDFVGQCAVCDLVCRMYRWDVLLWDCILCGIVFLEDFCLQGCGDVLLGKHPVLHGLVVHSAWRPWSCKTLGTGHHVTQYNVVTSW